MEVVKVPSNEVAEGKVVEQYPAAGSKVAQDSSVRITVAQRHEEEPKVEKLAKRQIRPRPDSLPEEPKPRKPRRSQDLPGESTDLGAGRERSAIEDHADSTEQEGAGDIKEGRSSSQRSEEPRSQQGRKSEKPLDLPD
jgi:beta-lactam-binding protein with PASTA domain